jgi:hypothetical protein
MDVMDSASGDTPLMLACRLGHEEMVAICLSYGAKNDPHPSFGQTALQVEKESSDDEDDKREEIVFQITCFCMERVLMPPLTSSLWLYLIYLSMCVCFFLIHTPKKGGSCGRAFSLRESSVE